MASTKLLCLIILISMTRAMADTFPWMNNYVACILRMPIYNYEPTILKNGTYSIKADKDEFAESDLIKVYIDAPDPSDIYKGLFITILEDGISRGEWMASPGFLHKSCDGSLNSALTEEDKTAKYVRNHVFSWKAPKCDPKKTYVITATVIRNENEFQHGIVSPLRCNIEKSDRKLDNGDNYYYDNLYYDYETTPEPVLYGEPQNATPKPEPEGGWEVTINDRNFHEMSSPEQNPEATSEGHNTVHNEDRKSKPHTATPKTTTTAKIIGQPPESGKATLEDYYYDMYSYEYSNGDVKAEPEPETNPESAPEPEGDSWANSDTGNDGYPEEDTNPEPEKNPSTPPMNTLFGGNPEPTSNPENSPEPEGNMWDNDEDDDKKYRDEDTKPEPEKNPSTPPINTLFGGNPEPTSNPENSPEPEGNMWDNDEDDDKKYGDEDKKPEPEKNPSTPPMNTLFGGNPEPTSNPENSPEPEGNMWEDDENDDKKYGDEDTKPEPEKNPSTPPINTLFGGNPEPTSNPENSPEPEGNMWDNDEDDDKKYGDEDPKPEPEKDPSTPPINTLFGGNPEPTSNPENSPEPEGNKWDGEGNDEIYGNDDTRLKPTDMLDQDENEENKINEEYYYDMYSYEDDSTLPKTITNAMPVTTQTPHSMGITKRGSETTSSPMAEKLNYDEDNDMIRPSPESSSLLKLITSSFAATATSQKPGVVIQPRRSDMTDDNNQGENSGSMDSNGYDRDMPEPSPEKISKPLGSCKNPIHNLPEGVSTSFERGDFGGWRNDSTAKRKWILRKGPTSSPQTGPNAAYNGKYYVYLEGSKPSRQGDQAILKGPSGLRGCFCIRFACHMHVDRHATLELKVNGVTVNHNRYSDGDWQVMTTTVDDASESNIEIVATRGMTFRSDIAIDDIRITEGICEE